MKKETLAWMAEFADKYGLTLTSKNTQLVQFIREKAIKSAKEEVFGNIRENWNRLYGKKNFVELFADYIRGYEFNQLEQTKTKVPSNLRLLAPLHCDSEEG